MKTMHWIRQSYLLLLLTAVPTAVIATLSNNFDNNLPANNKNISAMINAVIPSIVSITGKKRSNELQQPNGQNTKEYQSQLKLNFENYNENDTVLIGSGVIIDARKGYIISNSHVISYLENIQVVLSDLQKFNAILMWSDIASDLALLKIDANRLIEVKFSDSDMLQVGDVVLAVGNPYGFNNTVTSGIISGLNRANLGFDGYYDFIQTDAAINLGNSGGGLFNLQGELIGINTAMISTVNANCGNIGIGLAIPSNLVQSILSNLETTKDINKYKLGVQVQTLTHQLARGFRIETIVQYDTILYMIPYCTI